MSGRRVHLTNSLGFCLVPVDNGNVGKDTLAMAGIVRAAQLILGRHVEHLVVSLVNSVDTLVYPRVVHVELENISLKKPTDWLEISYHRHYNTREKSSNIDETKKLGQDP